jgi:hypothetical protein
MSLCTSEQQRKGVTWSYSVLLSVADSDKKNAVAVIDKAGAEVAALEDAAFTYRRSCGPGRRGGGHPDVEAQPLP